MNTLSFRHAFYNVFYPFVLLLLVLFISLTPVTNPDIGFHLKAGEQIFSEKAIPCCDTFSFVVQGKPFIHGHWLSQLIFYAVSFYCGENALAGVKMALVFLTFFYVFKTLVLITGNNFFSCLISIFLCVVSRYSLELLPLLFTPFFISFLLYVLFLHKKTRSKLIYSLPLIFFLWANFHPGFMSGIFVLILYLTGELFSRIFKRQDSFDKKELLNISFLCAISIMATLVNPDGFRLWLYPFALPLKATSYAFSVKMWQPSVFYAAPLHLFIALAAVHAVLLIFMCVLRRMYPPEMMISLVFLVFSLSAVRHIPLFCVAGAPFLGAAWRSLKQGKKPLFFVDEKALGVFALLMLAYHYYVMPFSPARPTLSSLIRETYLPKEAVMFLEMNGFSGNAVNDYDTGGYLIWKMSPRVKVFMDGRADLLYPESHFKQYQNLMMAKPGWRSTLKKIPFSFILSRNQSPLSRALGVDPEFVLVYQDYFYAIFISRQKNETHGSLFKEVRGSYYYFQKGNSLYLKKDYNHALAHYLKALAISPDIPLLYNNLGSAYLRLGNLKQAEYAFKHALRLSPDYSTARENLQRIKRLK